MNMIPSEHKRGIVILKEYGPGIIYVSPVCEVVGQGPNASPLNGDMAQD
jgi:hypothetical protein